MALLPDDTLASEAPLPQRLTPPEPTHFLEVVGERLALFGSENDRFELWTWPLLALHDLTFEAFDAATNAPIHLGARTVTALPEGVTLSYRCPKLTLDISIVASRTEQRIAFAFEATPTTPVHLGVSFQPAMRPMWPAGLGGQLVDRDEATGAVLLSEEVGRYAVLLGINDPLPPATSRASTAGRGIRDRQRILAHVDRPRIGTDAVIFAAAGAARTARPLTTEERSGGNQAATGFARAKDVIDEAREQLQHTWAHWPDLIADERRRWRSFLDRTATLDTDDEQLNDAFLWSKIAIERSWVNVPGVGRGIVAGYGPGRGGERPGFSWFFNGDAFEACLAYAALGEFDSCREILRFAASTQRDDGKLTHEVTLSAGLCNWFDDYPYAYYKGNQTPEFLVTLCDYARWSDDLDLVRELWPSAERAHTWCRSTCDDQGVMRIPVAGIAAVEAGPVSGRIDAELFLQGSWLEAQRCMLELAKRLGESIECFPSATDPQLARAPFEVPDTGSLAFARMTDGGHLDVLSTYTALPLARGVIAASDDEVLALNRPELTSDWGGRMFSAASEIYDAEHYNLGSVFPFLTQHIPRALYARGFDDAGWQVLRGQAALVGFGGPGLMPEFLAGDRARLLPHSVPHQVFSHAPLIRLVIEGLAGVRPGSSSGSVRLPLELSRLSLRGLPRAKGRFDVEGNTDRTSAPRAAFPWAPALDQPSVHPRLVGYHETNDGWAWQLAGPAGAEVSLQVSVPDGVSVDGATRDGDEITVTFPEDEAQPSASVHFSVVAVHWRRG